MTERTKGVWLLYGMMPLGLAALLFYISWWMKAGRMTSPVLVVGLVLALIYLIPQYLGSWFLYLSAQRRSEPPFPPEGLSVDVFVTACGEPKEIVARSLAAACAMRGVHRTWLLDDGADPALQDLARRFGSEYLTRKGRIHKKAGNINSALSRTTGDIIAIFDIDHVPRPEFLERTLGYFADTMVGFVQVMLTFSNSRRSWVARAAMETSFDFYAPTSIGADGVGGATMMGSNALIRREALTSIQGYRPGLAEDLATSMALHANGWRSIYVAEPLAPGLAPIDIPGWFAQQFKWARGVFEVLLTAYPRLFPRLTWGQRTSYAVRLTYYLLGPVIGIHMGLTVAILFFGDLAWQAGFKQYLFHSCFLVFVFFLIRMVAGRICRHPSATGNNLWRPVLLCFWTWPVYTLAWLMTLFRIPLAFRHTPKSSSGTLNPIWLIPYLAVPVLLVVGLFFAIAFREFSSPLLLGFAAAQAIPHLIFLGILRQLVFSSTIASEEPT